MQYNQEDIVTDNYQSVGATYTVMSIITEQVRYEAERKHHPSNNEAGESARRIGEIRNYISHRPQD